MEKKETFIDEYFKNPDNVSGDVYVSWIGKRVSPEEFYLMNEVEQEHSCITMKHIVCKDGFKFSVQASYTHYCSPRITIRSKGFNFYDSFEVGFPSEKEELLMPYVEDADRPTETVYGGVPKDVINEIIKKHNS